jgi:hypothetical protein
VPKTLALNAKIADAVTPEAVQAAYEAAVAGFEPAMEYNAAHILVETEEEAKDLLAQIEGGADFARLATEHSQDPGSGANGGSLGWFGSDGWCRSSRRRWSAWSRARFPSRSQTQFGWHLIRLIETRETTPPPLEAVRAEVENQVRQEAVQAEIEALRAGASIEMVENAVAPRRDPRQRPSRRTEPGQDGGGPMGKLKDARDKAAKAAVKKLRKQVKKLKGAGLAAGPGHAIGLAAGADRWVPDVAGHRRRANSPPSRPACATRGGST